MGMPNGEDLVEDGDGDQDQDRVDCQLDAFGEGGSSVHVVLQGWEDLILLSHGTWVPVVL